MVVTVVMPMKPQGSEGSGPPKRGRVVVLLVCLVGVIGRLVMAVDSISPRDRSPTTQRAGATRPAGTASAPGK